LVSANSSSIKPTTPEITEASNPIRNPPSATIREVLIVKNNSEFTVSFTLSYILS